MKLAWLGYTKKPKSVNANIKSTRILLIDKQADAYSETYLPTLCKNISAIELMFQTGISLEISFKKFSFEDAQAPKRIPAIP